MRDFNKTLLSIAVPVSLQSLIQASLSMIDQFMIGRLGARSIAAVGLGGKGLFILLFVLSGIGGGASVFLSQYWGKGERDKIPQVLGITLTAGGIVTLLFLLISLFAPGIFIGFFTADKAVIAEGSAYLRLIAPGYIPLLAVIAWSAALRSTGYTKLPMYAGLVSVLVNTVLNYLFIFGTAFIPAMGVEGAALATTAARFVEMVILLSVVYTRKLPGNAGFGQMVKISRDFAASFAVTSVPLVLTELVWVLGDSAFSAIYGRIGTDELAAMTLTGPVQMITIGLLTGVSTAASVILGAELGRNRKDIAGKYAWRFIIMGIGLTTVLGLIVIVLAPVYVSAFSVNDRVADITVSILKLFGLVLWIKVSNMIMGNGILRSGGDTRFVMAMDSLGMWLIGVPLGILSAFVLKLPFPMVYLLVSLEELVRMVFMIGRTRSGKWLNNLVENI